MRYRWMIEGSTVQSTNKIRFFLDGIEVTTEQFAQWVRDEKAEKDAALLQKDELIAVAKRHREERDHYRDERAKISIELEVANRLNDEYRKALEHISTMDSRVEPMSWSGAFAEAVRVSKDALSEKRKCEESHTISSPGDSICRRCGERKSPPPNWGS